MLDRLVEAASTQMLVGEDLLRRSNSGGRDTTRLQHRFNLERRPHAGPFLQLSTQVGKIREAAGMRHKTWIGRPWRFPQRPAQALPLVVARYVDDTPGVVAEASETS